MRTVIVLLLGAAVSSACGSSSTAPSSAVSATVGTFVAAAQTLSATPVTAVSRSGAPPAAGAGPTATVASSAQAAIGESNLVSIQSGSPFQTIYLSIGQAGVASLAPASRPLLAWLKSPRDLLEAPLLAAGAQDYLQIDISPPTTSADVAVSYPSSMPNASFDLQVQVAGTNGVAGPVATVHKTVTTPPVEMVGIVFGRLALGATGSSAGVLVDPVAGATVSTSLDSATTQTSGNGVFDLRTNTPSTVGVCFTLTITAAGRPTYSTTGWSGNKNTGPVSFTLSPAFPADPINGGCR